jgi:hypothetical protein
LAIGVLTLHLNIFISLVMSAFMNMFFHLKILNRLQRSPPLPNPNPPLLSSKICSTHRCSPPIQPSHPLQPTRHNIHHSFAHHHMHVYLTNLLQIQLANQCIPYSSMNPLLVMGHPLLHPLLLLIRPASQLLPTLPLLTILFLQAIPLLRQILPQPL